MYRYNIGTGDAASQQWRIVNTASRPTRLVVFHRPQETESNQQKPLRGDGTNASACVLTKANLFINGAKVDEDVTADVGQLTQAGITGPLPEIHLVGRTMKHSILPSSLVMLLSNIACTMRCSATTQSLTCAISVWSLESWTILTLLLVLITAMTSAERAGTICRRGRGGHA